MRTLVDRCSRRTATGVLAGAVALTVLGGTPVGAALASAGAKTPPAPTTTTLPAVAPRPADELADSYGVTVHLGDGHGVYSDEQKVTADLTRLGVRHVRTRLFAGRKDEYAALALLWSKGIRSNLILGDPTANSSPTALVGVVATSLPAGSVESLEGANEWNLSGRPDWVAELRRHQTELYGAAKAEPATAALPVLAPSMGMRRDFDAVSLRGLADVGNNHLYPGGQSPSVHIDELMAAERAQTGVQPVVFTEAGYHNAMNNTDSHFPTLEPVVGVYGPRLLLEHFSRGSVRVYNYELYDERPDPAKRDREANFGLIRYDGTPKPVYTAMQNLVGLVSDRGPAFTPSPLAYTVAGATPDVRQVLVQKRDGRSYLLLWRDVSVYDRNAEVQTTVDPVSVRVDLAAPADVRTYRPSASAAAQATVSAARSVPVDLAGDVVALEIGAAPALALPGTPEDVSAVAGSGSATVRWTPPADGAPVTGYRVVSSPDGRTATAGPTATSVDVPGLTNGTSYAFTVTATSTDGAGRPSGPTAAVVPTAASAPPAPPRVSAPAAPASASAVAGDRSATVRWSAAVPAGTPVTGYRVRATPGDVVTEVAGDATSAVVGGLENDTTYALTVTATSAAGDSPATAAGPVTPQAAVSRPGAPTDVRATPQDSGLLVDWARPVGGGAPAQYRVTATPGGATATVAAGSTSVVLDGLSNGTAYVVSVQAVNTAGAGPVATATAATTPLPVPGRPVGVTAVARQGGAQVSWPAAATGSGTTGFRVTTLPGGATTDVPASATSTVVGPLLGGVPYTFTVTALGVAGPSLPSAPTAAVLPTWAVRRTSDGVVLRRAGAGAGSLVAAGDAVPVGLGAPVAVSGPGQRVPAPALPVQGPDVTWTAFVRADDRWLTAVVDGVCVGVLELVPSAVPGAERPVTGAFTGLGEGAHVLTLLAGREAPVLPQAVGPDGATG